MIFQIFSFIFNKQNWNYSDEQTQWDPQIFSLLWEEIKLKGVRHTDDSIIALGSERKAVLKVYIGYKVYADFKNLNIWRKIKDDWSNMAKSFVNCSLIIPDSGQTPSIYVVFVQLHEFELFFQFYKQSIET